MKQDSNNNFPVYGGKNFAPVKPLLKAKDSDQVERNYVSDLLRDIYKAKMSENKDTWREIMSVGQMTALFIHGKQTLLYNPFSYTYVPVQLKPSDVVKTRGGMNVTQFYSTKHTQQWLASNPDIEIEAMGDDDRAIAAARAADILLDHYERKFYTHRHNLNEAILMQCFGTMINRVRFDNNAKGAQVLRDVFDEKEVEIGGGFGACEDCGFAGTAKDFEMSQVAENVTMPACRQCGSMAVTYEEPIRELIKNVSGQELVKYGDLRIDIVPLPAIRWDITTDVHNSSWAIIEQDISAGSVEHLLGSKMKLAEREGENQYGLDVMRAMQEMGGTVIARRDRNKDNATVTEMFLSARDLHGAKLKGDEETVSGETLPAGVDLSEMFPDGICVVGFNGLDVITGIHAESHKEQLSSGVYHVKPLTGVGKGISDMIESQKRLNKLDSQNLEYMQGMATPAVLYAKGAVSMEDMKYLGHPKANIPIDLAKFPAISNLNQLIHALPPGNAGSQFFEYTYNTLQNFMQLQSHVTEFSDGLPGVNNNTATGAQISQQLSQSLFQPLLAGKCDLRLGNAFNIVKTFKEYFPVKKFFPQKFKGQRRSSKGVWLSSADICNDLEFRVVKDSEAPKNKFVQRQEMMEVFNGIFGGYPNYLQAKMQVPEETNRIMQLYDIDLETDDYDEIGEICRERWEFARQATEQMLGVLDGVFGSPEAFDPTVIVSMAGIDPLELNQDKKQTWFQNLLDADEGRQATPQLKQVIQMFVATHFLNAQNQMAALAEAAGRVQMASQAPMMQAQAEQHQAMADQEFANQERQMQMDEAKAASDLENQIAGEGIKAVSKEIQNQSDIEKDNARLDVERQKQAIRQKSQTTKPTPSA